MRVPSYAELMARTDGPPGSSWGVFGAEDEVGTLNFIGPGEVRRAAGLVRHGTVFNLDHRLDAFDPPLTAHRGLPEHEIFSTGPNHRDDRVTLFPQATSQIDGLRHFRHAEHGFYNGCPDGDVTESNPRLGVGRYAERGIVGRGVLLDVARHLLDLGRPLDPRSGASFPASLLDEVAQAEGVAIEPGDIIMIRTGWLAWYFGEANAAERAALSDELRSPGLEQSHETLAWLWDRRVAVAASDNVGLEAIPARADSPFAAAPDSRTPVHSGLMHPHLIALLGLCIGELWDLEALAQACAQDGTYAMLVAAKPLYLAGGVGSPANAMAVK